MKKIAAILLVLACMLGCTGCFCGHSWVEADCLNPKYCPLCGRTEGQAPGHRWRDATCEEPQTCQICGLTQGEMAGHGWIEATCTAPRTCRWCGLTEGDALEHSWEQATTETPATCSQCGLTDGERIVTDERFVTAANQALFGSWRTETVLTGADVNLEDYVEQVDVTLVLTFREDGTLEKTYTVKDPDALKAELIAVTEERVYVRFEELEIDREEADELFADTYDMTIQEYAADFWADADMNGMLTVHNVQGAYYVADGALNMASRWDGEFTPGEFTQAGDRLTITEPDGVVLILARAE